MGQVGEQCARETASGRPATCPLDAFWQRRGYVRHDDLRTGFAWRELGEAPKTMAFWMTPSGGT